MAETFMPISEEKIIEIAAAYGRKLQDIFDSVEIRLFGSYLKHTANPHSDLDLAIISRDFSGMEQYTAMKILNRIKLHVDNIIEPIPLTPAELRNPDVGSLAYDIAQNSKVLFKAPF